MLDGAHQVGAGNEKEISRHVIKSKRLHAKLKENPNHKHEITNK